MTIQAITSTVNSTITYYSTATTQTSYKKYTVQPQILLRVNASDQIIPLDLTRTVLKGEDVHGRYLSDEKINFFLMDENGLQAWNSGQSEIRILDKRK